MSLGGRGGYSREGGGPTIPKASEYAEISVLECQHCNATVTLLDEIVIGEVEGSEVVVMPTQTRTVIYPAPSPRELHESVPNPIRSLYAEASVAENAGALRAAGVLYRAAAERLVKDQGAEGSDLYKRIESLAAKIPEVAADLHEARLLGNYSIHEGIEFTAEEVADVAELIEEATVVLYVQPAERQRMRESRKARRGL